MIIIYNAQISELPRDKVLLLDEALSNIDRETEQVVQATVAKEFQGFTTLVIAHRLDTILDSDSIAVFDQARLVSSTVPQPYLPDRLHSETCTLSISAKLGYEVFSVLAAT